MHLYPTFPSQLQPFIEQYTQDVKLVKRYYDLPFSEADRVGKRRFLEQVRETASRPHMKTTRRR